MALAFRRDMGRCGEMWGGDIPHLGVATSWFGVSSRVRMCTPSTFVWRCGEKGSLVKDGLGLGEAVGVASGGGGAVGGGR